MNLERAKDPAAFLLRVVAGLLFLQAGGMKLFDFLGGAGEWNLDAVIRRRRQARFARE